MLAPAAALAETPAPKNPAPTQQQAKPVPAKPDTWDSVNKELETNHTKTDTALVGYIGALKTKKDVDAKLAAVTTLKTARTDLEARIAKTTRAAFANPKAAPNVEKAETAWTEADTKLWAAFDAAGAAKEDPAIKTAVADLEKAKKTRTTAWAKVKAERLKANKRPRAPEEERPVGRGFILA
jgi:hypothetical protein